MNLDEMLSQPLPDVPDDGFSSRVMVRVEAVERRKLVEIVLISVIAAILVCLLLPLRAMAGDLAAGVIQMGLTPAFGIAVVVLAVTFLIDRLWSERQLLQF
jgi:polyferredoxin